MRGFDDYQVGKGKDPLSYHGVALLDARGASKIKDLAKAFKSLGYDVSVLADADAEDQFSTADTAELMKLGIPVYVWSGKRSLEERAFLDLPWVNVVGSLKLAQNELDYPVCDQVLANYQNVLDTDFERWPESQALRVAIGKAAKNGKKDGKEKGWFKDTTRGDLWFKVVSSAFNDTVFLQKELAVKLGELWTWAEHV